MGRFTVGDIIKKLKEDPKTSERVRYYIGIIEKEWYTSEERHGGFNTTSRDLWFLLTFLESRYVPLIEGDSDESPGEALDKYISERLSEDTMNSELFHAVEQPV
ncbi:MAG: hypothetical protein ACW99U_06095 [Candidatus Thorarchaeota archaeon]